MYKFKNLNEDKNIFNKIRPEILTNKKASKKKKKIVNLTDKMKKIALLNKNSYFVVPFFLAFLHILTPINFKRC